ncbi:MAG: hypothetical protein ABW221_18215 [Vicinamibacteria bacterium]
MKRARAGTDSTGAAWRRERDDLLLAGAALVVVVLVWRLALGWTAAASVSGYDAMATIIPVLGELAAAGGDWSALVYRSDLLGGMKVRDAVGPFPLFAWFARLGWGATGVYNASAFVVQALLGFFGARAAADLAGAWSERPLTWTERTIGLVLSAFAPALGWRLGYGHLTLVVGLLPFAAGLALVAAASRRTLSATLGLVGVLALTIGVLFTGHQLVVYGLVFGAPVLLGVWWTLGRRPGGLLWPVGACALALLLALPSLLPVLAHAASTDSPRVLGRTQITYSYLVERPADLAASVLWTRAAIPGGQPELHHHETNVPLGPLLVLLALVPWRRARGLAVGLSVSVLAAVLFSTNARPFSSALLAAIPPLGSFRVPTRALLPFALALPAVALAGASARAGRWLRLDAAIACAGAAVLFLLPGVPREVAGWALAVALVVPPLERRLLARVPTVGVLCALAAGGLGAFRERLLPFPEPARILADARRVGDELERARPELAQPLARVSLGWEDGALGPNTAFASGLSALDGYYFPSRRYIEMFSALHGYEYQPNALLLRFPASEKWTRPLFALYNVGWFVQRTDERRLQGRQLAPTAGAAWFSAGFETVPSFAALGKALLAADTATAERVRARLWLVESDPRISPARGWTVDPACAGARVLGVTATPAGTGVRVQVETPAECPLALAMNYVETLHAETTGAAGPAAAAVFPACGSLAAVRVPAGTRDVLVEARPGREP